jgi:hypothetical protein
LFKGLPAAASRAFSDVFYGLCRGGETTLTSIGRGLKERTQLEYNTPQNVDQWLRWRGAPFRVFYGWRLHY